MVRRLKEDLRRLGQPFPERLVEPIRIDGLPLDAPELRLAAMLDEYRQSSAGGARARSLFANFQQRLFSSIAAFHRTLTTHRKTLLKKRREGDPNEAEAVTELLQDNDLIEVATNQAKAELGDLDAASHDGWHWRGSQPGLLDAEVGHTTQNLLKHDPEFEASHIGADAAVEA
jgi:hypothetical protein